MTTEPLKLISDGMAAIGLNYAFCMWEGDPKYPYFTGEYQESPPEDESGRQDATFILTGFTRGSWLELETAKEKIENYFNRISGKTLIASNGTAVAVFYSNGFVVPTGDAELKRIEIHLDVKEWKVIL